MCNKAEGNWLLNSQFPFKKGLCTGLSRRQWNTGVKYWESQLLGGSIRSPGVPKERGIWDSQGEDRGLEFSRRTKGQMSCFCFFSLHSLVLATWNSLFSLHLELMSTQQTTQFKLCTRDYIATMYPTWGQFLLPEKLLTWFIHTTETLEMRR